MFFKIFYHVYGKLFNNFNVVYVFKGNIDRIEQTAHVFKYTFQELFNPFVPTVSYMIQGAFMRILSVNMIGNSCKWQIIFLYL